MFTSLVKGIYPRKHIWINQTKYHQKRCSGSIIFAIRHFCVLMHKWFSQKVSKLQQPYNYDNTVKKRNHANANGTVVNLALVYIAAKVRSDSYVKMIPIRCKFLVPYTADVSGNSIMQCLCNRDKEVESPLDMLCCFNCT